MEKLHTGIDVDPEAVGEELVELGEAIQSGDVPVKTLCTNVEADPEYPSEVDLSITLHATDAAIQAHYDIVEVIFDSITSVSDSKI